MIDPKVREYILNNLKKKELGEISPYPGMSKEVYDAIVAELENSASMTSRPAKTEYGIEQGTATMPEIQQWSEEKKQGYKIPTDIKDAGYYDKDEEFNTTKQPLAMYKHLKEQDKALASGQTEYEKDLNAIEAEKKVMNENLAKVEEEKQTAKQRQAFIEQNPVVTDLEVNGITEPSSSSTLAARANALPFTKNSNPFLQSGTEKQDTVDELVMKERVANEYPNLSTMTEGDTESLPKEPVQEKGEDYNKFVKRRNAFFNSLKPGALFNSVNGVEKLQSFKNGTVQTDTGFNPNAIKPVGYKKDVSEAYDVMSDLASEQSADAQKEYDVAAAEGERKKYIQNSLGKAEMQRGMEPLEDDLVKEYVLKEEEKKNRKPFISTPEDVEAIRKLKNNLIDNNRWILDQYAGNQPAYLEAIYGGKKEKSMDMPGTPEALVAAENYAQELEISNPEKAQWARDLYKVASANQILKMQGAQNVTPKKPLDVVGSFASKTAADNFASVASIDGQEAYNWAKSLGNDLTGNEILALQRQWQSTSEATARKKMMNAQGAKAKADEAVAKQGTAAQNQDADYGSRTAQAASDVWSRFFEKDSRMSQTGYNVFNKPSWVNDVASSFDTETAQFYRDVGAMGAAILRKESGAAIAITEVQNDIVNYIPTIADTKETVKSKLKRGINKVESLKKAAGPAWTAENEQFLTILKSYLQNSDALYERMKRKN